MGFRVVRLRTITILACLLTVAAACSSSHNPSNASTTTTNASSTTTTTDPDLTPNRIPYVVGEPIGLPHGWLVTVVKVEKSYANARLRPLGSGRQYIAIDIRMQNQGPAEHTVNADALFTLVDSAHKSHYVIPEPGTANGIEGTYPAGATRSGRLLFAVTPGTDLGLILYGPKIGTQVSYFAIIPPTFPQGQ